MRTLLQCIYVRNIVQDFQHKRPQAQELVMFLFCFCFFFLSSCKGCLVALLRLLLNDKVRTSRREKGSVSSSCVTHVCAPPCSLHSHTRAHASLTSLQTHTWVSELWQPVISLIPSLCFCFHFRYLQKKRRMQTGIPTCKGKHTPH